jgi:WD40 repeat protein
MEMPGPSDLTHPELVRLTAFAQGRVTREESSSIEAHLMECPTCCSLLEGAPEDPLSSLIRSAVGKTEVGPLDGSYARARGSSGGLPQVPGYEVMAEIGRGGMGVVYRAVQVGLGRTVALKMLLSGAHAGADELARFRAEGEAVARLRHPGVVQVFDCGTSGGLPYFAMELVEMGSLASLLRGVPHSAEEASAFVEALAHAVAAAHRTGIIHRDLKPANILLAREGGHEGKPGLAGLAPKITDFGLARWAERGEGLTRTGALAGTPAYMSPEQAAGKGEVGPAVDVWALGAVLYEILTGRPPFQGATTMDTLDRVRHADPVPPGRLATRLPRDLEVICLKCLEKEPGRRYPSAAALANDLGRYRRGEPIQARPAGMLERAWKWARRRPALASLLAATIAALVIGFGVSAYFAIEARQRAGEARLAEREARGARVQSDRHAAHLLFREGVARCEAGDVALGMYTLLEAWRASPEEDAGFRRVVRANLAGWRWHLPRLRGIASHPGPAPFKPISLEGGASFATWSDTALQAWSVRDASPLGPTGRARPGERFVHPFPDGSMLCVTGGMYSIRNPNGGPGDERPLPDWTKGMSDFQVELRGPGGPDLILQGPIRQDLVLSIWPMTAQKKEPVRVPSGGGMSFRVARARSGQDVLVVYRRHPRRHLGEEEVEVWSLESGKKQEGFEPMPGGGDPAVSWDGRSIVTVSTVRGFYYLGPAGHDGSARVWEARTLRQAGLAFQPRRAAWFTEVGGDHATLAAWCRDWRMRVYDLGTGLQRGGDIRANLDGDGAWVPPFTLSSDGGALIAVDRHRELHVWDLRHLRLQSSIAASPRISRPRHLDGEAASSAAFSPGRESALCCPQALWGLGTLVDVEASLPRGEPLEHRHIFNPAFSGDGKLAVTLSHNHVHGGEPIARVWDAATGAPRSPPIRNPKYLHCAAFSPDSSLLALGGTSGAHLWDFASGKLVRALPEKSTACCLLFRKDGKRLAAGFRAGWPGHGSGVRLWSTQDGKPLGSFVVTRGNVKHLAFSEDGASLLALAEGRFLWRLDAETGAPLGEPLPLAGGVTGAFAADASLVATADYSGTVRQYRTADGQQVGSAMHHPARVARVLYDAQARLLATLCEDESARLWDAESGLPLGPPLAHRVPVLAIDFTLDGRGLRTLTDVGRVRTWPVPEPVIDDEERFASWLEGFSGMRRKGDEVVLLSEKPWREAVALHATRWPVADPALEVPQDDGPWHEARAAEAEEEGNVTAALLHLGRLAQRRPTQWAWHARRGRALAEAGGWAESAQAYSMAEDASLEECRGWYRHRIAALRSRGAAADLIRWYTARLRRAEGSRR